MGDAAATKNAIDESAIKEFLDKGFERASLRQIVKNAGVTTGAFYKYYNTKEELFSALVEPYANVVFDIYDSVLSEFEEQDIREQTRTMEDYSKQGIDQMIDYIYEHFDHFLLLLCKAEGTRNATFIHDLTIREVDSALRYMENMKKAGMQVPEADEELMHMIYSGFFSGIFEIVIHNMDRVLARRRITQFNAFYSAGWKQYFGFSVNSK